MKELREVLVCLVLAALLALVVQAVLLEREVTTAARVLPGIVRFEIQETRRELRAEVDKQASGIRTDAMGQISTLRTETMARVDVLTAIVDRRAGEVLEVADSRLGEATGAIAGLRGDLQPVLANTALLEANYAALPGQLGEVLKPSWTKVDPEITCQQADGTGYGGCWHARVTALLGESARAGGIFVQHFPALADSMTGIAGDAHHMTGAVDRKFFPPAHKMTAKEKAVAAAKILLLISLAALRGGAF